MDVEAKKRPPHLEIELDALEHAADVARATGMSEDTAIAGLVRMWRHCWRERALSVPALAVRGFFGHDAAEALQTFGFLGTPAVGGQYPVRGAPRMLRVEESKHDARSRGGHAAKRNLRRGTKSPGSAPAAAGSQPEGQPGVSRESAGEVAGSQPETFPALQQPSTSSNSKEEGGSLSATHPAPAEQLQALWAEEADARLARWKESGPERRKAASNALRQRKLRDGPDSWLDVIQRINVTPFLLGANERGWKATLDWLLKPGRAAKVLEGNYADAEAGPAPPKAPATAPFGISNAWQGPWCAKCDGPAAYEHEAVPLCWEHLPQEARAAHA